MTPQALLSAAIDVLGRSEFGLEGVWPRTAAFLGRQSLETALDMAQDTVGRSPQVSVFHLPPVFMIDME